MKKIITYGTFDLFHKGHYNILKRAKDLGDYLIVGVTGENYDAERGKLSVQDSLATRIENVRNTGFADLIIVEEYDGQKINDIIKYEVDILVLGLDWKGKFDHLKKYCDVIYLERTKDISSTQLRKEYNKIYKYGIVTDDMLNENYIFDPEYVSGIHIQSIYSEYESISSAIVNNSHIDKTFSNYDDFLQSVDIVSVHCSLDKRYEYIKKALLKNRHVISESPISLDPNKVEEIYSIAKNNKCIFLENVPTVYIKTFNQLLSIAKGAIIGDIVRVKCSLPIEEFSYTHKREHYDALYYIICILQKILGEDTISNYYKLVKHNNENSDVYLYLDYENSFGIGEITNNTNNDSSLEIIGTKGIISMPTHWWKAGYFKTKLYDIDYVRRYCTNFEGNGFKYLIQTMIQMIKENQFESQRLSSEDSIRIVKIINQINF